MKLLKLELRDFRGVRDTITIEPQGENMVVLGPNGTGKSTIVDAVDFLLSGKVSRLLGAGTAGITLREHGAHVDAKKSQAWVRALVELPGVAEPVQIERHLASPNSPKYDSQHRTQLEDIFSLAASSQHLLTRRDVLQFVTAVPSRRGEMVQELLGIKDIKKARDALSKVRRTTEKEASSARDELIATQSMLSATAGFAAFSVAEILGFVNQNRRLLGAKPIDLLEATAIRSDIDISSVSSREPRLIRQLFEQDVNTLLEMMSATAQERRAAVDSELRQSIHQVQQNPSLRRAFRAYNLTKLGLELLDETDECPLCGHVWPAHTLQQQLQHKLKDGQVGKELRDSIKTTRDEINNDVQKASSIIARLVEAAQSINFLDPIEHLHSWSERLSDLSASLRDPLSDYQKEAYDHEQVSRLMVSPNSRSSIEALMDAAQDRIEGTSPEQTAFELLIRLATEVEHWQRAANSDRVTQITYRRAARLFSAFEESRDHVLNDLYDAVLSRFEALYRAMHSSDEDQFTAILRQEGAGVTLAVDYFGRGSYPPGAIHSEGHQDSMGVCLFLALSEHINQGRLDLVVLDDVLMAIDADHRRAFGNLLIHAFPNRQFLITTHDRAWAYQLKYQGLVRSRGFLEITYWDLASGPRISSETEMWQRIDLDLQSNDIPAAAARLRRGSEEFYSQVCHQLRARVPYDMTNRYDLGDLLNGALAQYKDLLKQAKKCANSWNDIDTQNSLVELDEHRANIYEQLAIERWAVNPAVHYSKWENFSRADFLPVVEAFRQLETLFVCANCSSLIQLSADGPSSVRCRCGQINWNLESRH